MKMYKLFTWVIIAAISFSFAACSDDDKDEDGNGIPAYPEDNTTVPRLIRVERGGGDLYVWEIAFNYEIPGNHKRLTRYVEKINNTTISKSIVFKADGNIESINIVQDGAEDRIITYKYEGNKIISSEGDVNLEEFTINSSGRLENYHLFATATAKEKRISFEYYENGNVVKVTVTQPEELTEVRGYGYNNAYGIFKNIDVPQWFLFTQIQLLEGKDDIFGQMVNNVAKVDILLQDKDDKEEEGTHASKTITSKLDEKGFPTELSIDFAPINKEDEEWLKPETVNYIIRYNYVQ